MAKGYFSYFSNLELPSFTDGRNSSYDYVTVKNLFRRGKIREDFFQNATVFDKYSITGDERPDEVANKVYGSPLLDWVVLISNNVINIRDEWPMGQTDFNNYLDDKYSQDQLNEIHHYETKELKDATGSVLLSSGLVVDQSYIFMYTDLYGDLQTVSGSDVVTSVSYFDYEQTKNDDKRSIFILRPEYLQTVIDDMRDIMTYTDSSQYIDKRTKKGANVRILDPR
jgi:hypothetical protein